MTMQSDIVQLLMESAPVDPFDDDGPRKYRVVAVIGRGARRRNKVNVTLEHFSEGSAMAVLADKVLHAANSQMLHQALAQISVLQGRLAVLEQQIAGPEPKRRRR